MAFDLRRYTTSKDLLHQALLDAGSTFARNKYTCPNPTHEDKHPSTNLYEKEGKWRFHCQSCHIGGDLIDLKALVSGRTPESIILELKDQAGNGTAPKTAAAPAPTPPKPKKTYPSLDAVVETNEFVTKGKCTRRHQYAHPDTGDPELVVLRIEQHDGKEFRPVYPVEGGWQMGYAADCLRPIYNRTRVAQADTILVVEGEKCVEAAYKVGITATTSPGGSKAADKADWSPLAGKTVVIWRDNDPPRDPPDPVPKDYDPRTPGEYYQDAVIAQLIQLHPAPTIRAVDVSTLILEDKDDIVDFIARERKEKVNDATIADVIRDIMAEAVPAGGSLALWDRIQATIAGKIVAIPWPWPQLSRMTKALLPGTVTVICGDPGASKSFVLIQCCMHWVMEGHKVACMELEEDAGYHLQRGLAQLMEDPHHFTPQWIKNNPAEAEAAYRLHQTAMDRLGQAIFDDPEETATLDSLTIWVEKRCEEGYRIIAIDPLTIADVGREPWISERLFMTRVKRALRKSGASLILVTHPKKGRQNVINMDQLSGSTAWPRFSACVIWIEHIREDEDVEVITVKQAFGGDIKKSEAMKCNRRFHMCKTRNGAGHGLTIACKFRRSMLTEELGLVAAGIKKNRTGKDD